VLHGIAAGARWAVAVLCLTSAAAWSAEHAGGSSDSPSATTTGKIEVAVRLPKEQAVSYKGIADFDGAGAGALNMLYPAPNAAGALVAVLTHAVIADSAQSRQRRELQEAADRVLDRYRSTLARFTHDELITRALRQPGSSSDVRAFIDQDGGSGAALVVDPAVVFYMTQDQRALVLYAAFAIRDAAQRGDARNYTVRVVGHPQQLNDALVFWTADDGAELRQESALLLAQALDLALSEARAPRSSPEGRERTFRYPEGTVERMERASLVSETCERAVIRTLRGELMSIPLPARSGPTSAGACARKP